MALQRAKNALAETPEPAINVAPAEDVSTTDTETTATNGASKDRMAWTAEKVRVVKAVVRESPGITFDALLATLRAGELADHLAGVQGKQRLLNLISNIRRNETKQSELNAKLTAEGKDNQVVEFTPLPEVVMPVSMARPNLLEG